VKLHIFILLLICTFSFKTTAQLINESNRVNWLLSGLQYQPIPQNIINVKKQYNLSANGVDDDALKIQTALNEAEAGSLLYFEAGTYLLKNKIDLPDNIIIRGSGADKTSFNFDLGAYSNPPLECIVVATYQYRNYVDALAAYNKNSTFVVVENSNEFSANSYAEIEQDNDAELMYSLPIWDVTYRSELNPQIRPTVLKENIGIENLKIERLDDGDNHTIVFVNAANCWVWNIESEKTVKSHIWIDKSLNIQIQNSYFHQSFETLRHAMMVKEGANGNVFSFNYSRNPVSTNLFSLPADISVHGHYPLMNLFESNIVQKISCTDYWGPAGPGNTFFRNRIESLDLTIKDFSHKQNVIANEITSSTGIVSIGSNSNNILKHGNNQNGSIEWTTELLPYNLPQSLYLNQNWDDALYSYIGPEYELNSGINDAKVRFANNENINCYTGNTKIYINENLVDGTSEHLQNKFICTGNVIVGKSDTVQILSAVSISLRSGFKVSKGACLKLGIVDCD